MTIVLSSCWRNTTDSIEGWDYNNPKTSGFQKVPFDPQETSPGTVLIEGGKATFISTEGELEDHELTSFYIGATEEPNIYYLTYLNFVKKYYSKATYEAALPDTTVWLDEAINDSLKTFLVSNYLRDRRFQYFPVVGLNITQINRYLEWKTDRVNEFILMREEVFDKNYVPKDSSEVFSTNDYLVGDFDREGIQKLPDLDPSPNKNGRKDLGVRIVRMEDGILLPKYRLPTFAEWKWAAFEIGDSNHTYLQTTDEMKSFEKCNYFVTLNQKAPKRKRQTYSPFLPLNNKERLVMADYGYRGNYQMCHMTDNVPEMTAEGHIINLNWESEEFSVAAKYDETLSDSLKYLIDDNIPISQNKKGAIGFRVAVDMVGPPPSAYKNIKRRKGRVI